MKKAIALFILIFTLLKSGQSQDVKNNPNLSLNKFVGTWVYQKDDKNITVTLKKSTVTVNGISYDVIEGYHSFKNGQKVIESPNTLTLKGGVTFTDDSRDTPNQLHIDFFDPTKKKGGKVVLTMSPDNPDEIVWTIKNFEGFRIHKSGEKTPDRTFTLPEAMIFKRQK